MPRPVRIRTAFTLLEMVAVLVLILVLAGIAVPTYQAVIGETRDNAAELSAKSYAKSIDAYAATQNVAPNALAASLLTTDQDEDGAHTDRGLLAAELPGTTTAVVAGGTVTVCLEFGSDDRCATITLAETVGGSSTVSTQAPMPFTFYDMTLYLGHDATATGFGEVSDVAPCEAYGALLEVLTPAAHGTFTFLTPTGAAEFTYDPADDFAGVDTVTVRATCGPESATAVYTFNVFANTAPAAGNDTYTLTGSEPLDVANDVSSTWRVAALDVLANDADADEHAFGMPSSSFAWYAVDGVACDAFQTLDTSTYDCAVAALDADGTAAIYSPWAPAGETVATGPLRFYYNPAKLAQIPATIVVTYTVKDLYGSTDTATLTITNPFAD